MKKIILCSAIGLFLISLFFSCSQEEMVLKGTMAYSEDQIMQIEEMKRAYGINVTIPYLIEDGELPSIECLKEYFQMLAELQISLKRVEMTSDTTATIKSNIIKRTIEPYPEVFTGTFEDVKSNGYATYDIDFSWKKIHPTRSNGTFSAIVKHIHAKSTNYDIEYCNLSSYRWVSSMFVEYVLKGRVTLRNNANWHSDFALTGDIDIIHNSKAEPL